MILLISSGKVVANGSEDTKVDFAEIPASSLDIIWVNNGESEQSSEHGKSVFVILVALNESNIGLEFRVELTIFSLPSSIIGQHLEPKVLILWVVNYFSGSEFGSKDVFTDCLLLDLSRVEGVHFYIDKFFIYLL